MNTIPINIKYKEILENKKIKCSTDTTGFLVIIIKIPRTIGIIVKTYKNVIL
jgi:hypothetical protein